MQIGEVKVQEFHGSGGNCDRCFTFVWDVCRLTVSLTTFSFSLLTGHTFTSHVWSLKTRLAGAHDFLPERKLIWNVMTLGLGFTAYFWSAVHFAIPRPGKIIKAKLGLAPFICMYIKSQTGQCLGMQEIRRHASESKAKARNELGGGLNSW